MSKTRKILSLLVAIVMVFGTFSICAFAANVVYEDAETTNSQTWALSAPVKQADGSYNVDVTLKTNYETGAIQFVIKNTDGNATLTSVTKGAALYYTADIMKTNKGKVIITPKTNNTASIAGQAIDGVIVTLTYTVASGKQAVIELEKSPKTATNVAGSLVAARAKDLVNSTNVVGQPVTYGTVTQTLGEAAKPELYVKSGTNGVIDTKRTAQMTEDGTEYTVSGLLYGVEVCYVEDENGNGIDAQAVTDVFAAKNGSLNVIQNEVGSTCGTGTKVQLLDKGGNVVATYILVIFGDIDGNGEIDTIDSGLMELHASGIYDEDDGQITDTVVMLAADIDCNDEIDTVDSGIIELHAGGIYDEIDGQMSQFEIAAKLS